MLSPRSSPRAQLNSAYDPRLRDFTEIIPVRLRGPQPAPACPQPYTVNRSISTTARAQDMQKMTSSRHHNEFPTLLSEFPVRPARGQGPGFRSHAKAHEAIVQNEFWYGDEPPTLGEQFTVRETTKRKDILVSILVRAVKRAGKAGHEEIAHAYHRVRRKLKLCHPRSRCGSLACPQCARAFQKAKVAAQQVLITQLQKTKPRKTLVMANVVALHLKVRPDQLHELDIRKRNRWLKDILRRAGLNRVMIGSADLSWEDGYYQLHWHIAMWTANAKKLTQRLKPLFPGVNAYDRPVVVSETCDLGFLAYKDKGIKLPDLLRRNRRHLADLLLVLDRTEPLDLMVIAKLRLSAQVGGLRLRPIAS